MPGETLKKTLLFAVVFSLVVGAVFLSGCLQQEGSGSVVLAQPGPVKLRIGALLDLTGKGASYGNDARDAALLAVEDLRKTQKSLEVELLFEDSQSEDLQAVNSAKKLLEIDGVRVILGPVRSNEVLAVAPLTEAKKAILFTFVASADEITNAGDFVFRNRETGSLHGGKIAEFIKSNGIDAVAVLSAQSANSKTYASSFVQKFEALGGKIAKTIEYNENLKDFKSEIVKALEANPKVLYVSPATDSDGIILIRQIKEFGFKGLIAGAPGLDSQAFLQSGVSEGVVITSPFFDSENTAVKEFSRRFEERFGRKPAFYTANAYDAVMLLGAAALECKGDENTECLRDFLYNVKNYEGLGGLTTFDGKGDVIKPVMVKKAVNGKFERLE